MNKEGSFKPIIFVMIASMIIAFYWDKISIIKNSVSKVLNPSAGALLNWNLTWGFVILILIITIVTTFVRKYTTDQKTLKELREQQKEINKRAKKVRDNPEKMMEIQKELMPLTMEMMKLNMRSIAYTGIPFILFFRWFMDFFNALGNPVFLGFLSWFWFYLIFTMIFSSILGKTLKVA